MKERLRKAAEDSEEHIDQEAFDDLLKHSVMLRPDFELPKIRSDAGSKEKPAPSQKINQTVEKGSLERTGDITDTEISCFEMAMPIDVEKPTNSISRVKKELDLYMARAVTESLPCKGKDRPLEPKLPVKMACDGAEAPGPKNSLSSNPIGTKQPKSEAKRLTFSEPVKGHNTASKLMFDKSQKTLEYNKKMALNYKPDNLSGNFKIESTMNDMPCNSRNEWSFKLSMKEGDLDRGNNLKRNCQWNQRAAQYGSAINRTGQIGRSGSMLPEGIGD